MARRFPCLEPEEYIATFLDPVTKPYAQSLLQDESDTELYTKTKLLLKKIHRQSYHAILTKTGPPTDNGDANADSMLEVPMPPPIARKRSEFSMTTEYNPKAEQELEESEDDIADKILEDYLVMVPRYKNYSLSDIGEKRLLDESGEDVDILDLIAYFDGMKWLRDEVLSKYPSIIMLIRVYLSRMDNGGFQERVFSTAAHIQGENQCRMDFDMLEMRTLLCQNKDLIRADKI